MTRALETPGFDAGVFDGLREADGAEPVRETGKANGRNKPVALALFVVYVSIRDPNPPNLYYWWFSTHPSYTERIMALMRFGEEKGSR
ncbi:MAG: hypothetical protein BAA02_05540 [Paenibacillaceae bacterium ZCTH02-B3]|nr:MAG: hypothetical protein BAA02_05540 [Paenibacillaceae bacterium ZCTH02-B3]